MFLDFLLHIFIYIIYKTWPIFHASKFIFAQPGPSIDPGCTGYLTIAVATFLVRKDRYNTSE